MLEQRRAKGLSTDYDVVQTNANPGAPWELINPKWGPSVGLFQVRSLRHPNDYSVADRYRVAGLLQDPEYNALAAFAISKGGTPEGWALWTTYRTGSYVKFAGKDFPIKTGHPRAAEWSK